MLKNNTAFIFLGSLITNFRPRIQKKNNNSCSIIHFQKREKYQEHLFRSSFCQCKGETAILVDKIFIKNNYEY